MQNWVKNIITISPDTMKSIQEKYFSDGELDFGKVITPSESFYPTEYKMRKFELVDNTMMFETNMDYAYEIFYALSMIYPAEEFKVQYAGERTGRKCGWASFKNGEEDICIVDDVKFAKNVWDFQLEKSVVNLTALESEAIDAISASDELGSTEPSKASDKSR